MTATYTHRLVTPGWKTLLFASEKGAHEALIFLAEKGEADWSRSYVEPIRKEDGAA